jgi:TRAP-type C4-dicarboxylate transport system substrate-binding protein
VEKFYKGLEEVTNGKIKVRMNPGGALGDAPGIYQRTLIGIANIGHFNPGFNTGVFPQSDVFFYPSICSSSEQLTRFQLKLYDMGYFDKEYSKLKMSAFYNIGAYVLFSNKKITKVDDFKGLKIRIMCESWVEIAKALGAVPVNMPTGEMYLAMQKGIVDTVVVVWDASLVFKLGEVSKYVSELFMTSSIHGEGWNKKSWNALPQEGKDYIEKNWKEYSINCSRTYDQVGAYAKKKFVEGGGEVVQLEPGELEKMEKIFSPVWEKWIARNEAKGLPAKKLVMDLKKMMEESGKGRVLYKQ